MLILYLLLAYAAAFYVLRTVYIDQGMLTINDLLIFCLAPFSFVPIIAIYLLSHVVDLETVLFTNKNK